MRWLQNFMRGRYGVDSFGFFLLISFILCSLFSTIFQSSFLYLVSVAVLIYAYFRILSKNIFKRSQENARYLRYTDPIRFFFSDKKREWNDRKTYKYYKCPNCKQKLRVPRGRGEITITCPKCKTKFDKRT